MPVYLARFGALGPVKIGVSMNVAARLEQISSRLWDKLSLLRMLEGDAVDERRLHARFAHLRIRFEWYHYCPEMMGDLGLLDITRVSAKALSSLHPRHQSDAQRVAFAHAVRSWMEQQDLSEQDVATAVGCSAATVADWLSHGWATHRKTTRDRLIELSGGQLRPAIASYDAARAANILAGKAARIATRPTPASAP